MRAHTAQIQQRPSPHRANCGLVPALHITSKPILFMSCRVMFYHITGELDV